MNKLDNDSCFDMRGPFRQSMYSPFGWDLLGNAEFDGIIGARISKQGVIRAAKYMLESYSKRGMSVEELSKIFSKKFIDENLNRIAIEDKKTTEYQAKVSHEEQSIVDKIIQYECFKKTGLPDGDPYNMPCDDDETPHDLSAHLAWAGRLRTVVNDEEAYIQEQVKFRDDLLMAIDEREQEERSKLARKLMENKQYAQMFPVSDKEESKPSVFNAFMNHGEVKSLPEFGFRPLGTKPVPGVGPILSYGVDDMIGCIYAIRSDGSKDVKYRVNAFDLSKDWEIVQDEEKPIDVMAVTRGMCK